MEDKENPEILVYRRTHTGDPNENGIFGCDDCMGGVRDFCYDAVIGIGGCKPDPGDEGIKERITWIGIGPHKTDRTQEDWERMKKNPKFKDFRGQLVTFKKFLFLDENDPEASVENKYPVLYKYMFKEGRIPRYAKNFAEVPDVYVELKDILKLADNATPSPARDISIKSNPLDSKSSSLNGTNKSRGCA